MTGWLLDHKVLFELRSPRPDLQVKSWSDAQPRESFFVSAATIAAIRHLSERQCDAALHTEVGIWIEQVLRPWFAARVLPLSEDVVLEWRRLLHQRSRTDRASRPASLDLILIATARVHRLTLCTRDARAHAGAGASAFNPWNPAAHPT